MRRALRAISCSSLALVAAAACSGESPQAPASQGAKSESAPPSSNASVLSYFEGTADPAHGTMSVTVRSPSGQIQTQSGLPYGSGPGAVYFHGCNTPSYAAHQLTGTEQGVNQLGGTVMGFSAVIDTIVGTGVTLASGPGSGSTSGVIANYGLTIANTATCASSLTWAFSDPSDVAFTFTGHAEGKPPLPVTSGLVAAYDARILASLTKDSSNNVSAWADISGNGENFAANVAAADPVWNASLINSAPGLNMSAGQGMISPAYALTTSMTVFTVIQWSNSVGSWGSVAHHGDRDSDWAIEQNAAVGGNVTHFQSCNDNSGDQLTLTGGTNYILVGVIQPSGRQYFAVSTAAGVQSATATGDCISAGSKTMYIGRSNNNEPFNGYYGEMLYYTGALSGAQVNSVISYLRSSWGI